MNKKIFSLLTILLLSGCTFNINSNNTSLNNSNSINSSSISINIQTQSSSSINNDHILGDPYIGMSRNEFYSNYKEATSYEDAMYRTEHGFISGSIEYENYKPTKKTLYKNGQFLKFNNYSYGYDENNEIISYDINTEDGKYKTIYKGAAYISLEEVSAYILAFGEVPPNSNYDKGTKGKKASIEKWGEYGRVNIGKYKNDVISYPNEPELPLKDSNNKYYQYIETDFGLEDYNDGYSINRGTNRIVFTGQYQDGSKVKDINERYVFYTYNHYEDFQEYLNYYGGWGDRFGYETGNEIKPTPHIEALIVDKNTL